MEETLLATYLYSDGRTIDVYGFNPCGEDRYENYDIYEDEQCLNEGDVFFTMPSYKAVKKYLKKYDKWA